MDKLSDNPGDTIENVVCTLINKRTDNHLEMSKVLSRESENTSQFSRSRLASGSSIFLEWVRSATQSSIRSSADFERAILETGFGKFHYLLLLLAFPAACSSSFETTTLSYVMPTASCDLKLNAYDRGILNGITYAGMIASSCVWGFVSDHFGRRKMLLVGYLGDFVFSAATTFSQSFWQLLIFKFLSGVMISGSPSIFLTYLSEMFNSKRRDNVVMAFGLFQSLGGLVHVMLAWLTIPRDFHWTWVEGVFELNGWRSFLLVSTLPSLLAWLGIVFSYESPRFLLAKGRKEEALRVFRKIYVVNSGQSPQNYGVSSIQSETDKTVPGSLWQELTALFRPPHVHKALLCFAIGFGALLSMNSIRLWLPQMFYYTQKLHEENLTTCEILAHNATINEKKTDCKHFVVDTSVYTNMLFVNILVFISLCICTVLVGFVGKRNMLFGLFLIQSLVVAGVGWLKPPFNMAVMAVFVAVAYTSTIGLLSFVVQIFPTTVRTMGMSMTLLFGRAGVVLGNAFLPHMLNLTCSGTFIVISTISIFCGVVVFLLAAEISKKETTN